MGDEFRPLLLLVNLVSDLPMDWNSFLPDDLYEIVTTRSLTEALQTFPTLQPDFILISARGLSPGEQEQLETFRALASRGDAGIPVLFLHAGPHGGFEAPHADGEECIDFSPVFTDPGLSGAAGPVLLVEKEEVRRGPDRDDVGIDQPEIGLNAAERALQPVQFDGAGDDLALAGHGPGLDP